MLFKEKNKVSNITKVSQLIDTKSHKQKKYISLMVVPSYSTGRTRTLRVPRMVFHGVIAAMLVISAIVLGFYLRSSYFQRTALNLESSLVETENRYSEFRAYAQEVQDNLIETAAQIYEELSETETRAQEELNRQAESHNTELEVIIDQIEEIEQIIRDLETNRQAIIEGLSKRGDMIPPVAALVAELEASQGRLIERAQQEMALESSQVSAQSQSTRQVGLLSTAAPIIDEMAINAVRLRLDVVLTELTIQQILTENLEIYHTRMDLYLRNHPTLWPTVGDISSPFGFRWRGRFAENHRGIDISAPHGQVIRAPGGGVVTFAGWRNGFGNTVQIDHGAGKTTLYAHASRLAVSTGQHVSRGDVIAYIGSTGDSTGPHLHYEVKLHGVHLDPMLFMHEHYR